MAKNIDFMGATFPDVPSIRLPQHEGGLVSFDDTTDATATADKILQGYTAYANGQKLTGTASGGITPSGTISITQNGTVDVTQYASADVNVSGGGASLKPIALRPDAELIHSVYYDKLIVADEGITIPAYSTSTKTLKSGQSTTLSSLFDPVNDDILYVTRAIAYPIYSTPATHSAGKFEYYVQGGIGVIIPVRQGSVKSFDGEHDVPISSGNLHKVLWNSASYSVYQTSSGFDMVTTTTGTYMSPQGPSNVDMVNGNITFSKPALSMRGNTTYYNQAAWEDTTDIRYQYAIEIYKTTKGTLNVDGWEVAQDLHRAFDCAVSPTHTLT